MRRAGATIGALLGLAATLVAGLVVTPAAHASLEPYAQSNDPMATTPSTDEGAFGAWHNPAVWAIPERAGFDLSFFGPTLFQDLGAWQAGLGRRLGFAVRHRDGVRSRISPADDSNPFYEPYAGARPALPSLTEYQVAISGGDGGRYGGMSWHLNSGGGHAWKKSNYLSFGHVARPDKRLSIGWVSQWAPATGDGQNVIDLGIRPDGSSRLMLFADYSGRNLFEWEDATFGVGALVRPFDGLEVSGRWRDDDRFQITAGVTLARFGARATSTYRRDSPPTSTSTLGERNRGSDHRGTWYSFRSQPPVRGIDVERRVSRNRYTMSLDLHGRAVYQSHRWFDGDSRPLRDLTEQIRFAKEDPTVGGVAIGLSGFEANISMLWELRESLLALKRAGKRVLIAADHLDQRTYYLASVADRLALDPLGGMLAPGVQASRTYMKDLLAKLGLGFDEWRYYKYKSALETFSRTSFSDADREQFEALTRAAYDELANGIAASGRITRDRFDQLVNEEPYVTATRMKELGLVDDLARWEDVERELAAGGHGKPRPYAELAQRRWQPDETWGPVPTVALVYLVGDCAMDTGIRARATAPAMRKLREDPEVGAVVLRVDSPGGDPLASDLVADETRKLRAAAKPVHVSQGRVAGSGGYWISADGDSIAGGPFTITGSIGIIGGWVWNDGFGKKLGLTSDRVQIGRSADLLGGLRIPFLGAQLPERNLDEGERRHIHGVFDDLYGTFVRGVAKARRLEESRVRELAEGRVYDGKTAVENKLIDRIATLEETLESAKRGLKVGRGQRVRVVEYPPRPLVRLPRWLPGGLAGPRGFLGDAAGAANADEPRLLETSVFQQILDQPGRPLLLTPGSLLPLEKEAAR
jgi:protease-4